MGREIKFRAWDKETSNIVDVIFLSFRLNKIKVTHWDYGDSMLSDLGDFDLLQYTGLKDKNGVEIYEGDIIKNIDGRIYTVTFGNGGFGCKREITIDYRTQKKHTSHEPLVNYVLDGCEVIGNIYENPELLQKEETN